MTSDDESLDETLNRYMGQAGDPPAGQVASSVEAVWEQLRPEADCATLPARRMVTRRSHFTVAIAVLVVTMTIGLYEVQRAGLLQVMFPVQQTVLPPVAPASQSPAVSVDPVREPSTIEAVAGSTEAVGRSEARQASAAAAPEAALSQSTGAGTPPLPFSAAPVRSRELALDARDQPSQSTIVPAASLVFQVASIKPVPPPIPSRAIVGWAYEVLPTQVKGGPNWIDRERYDVDARAESSNARPTRLVLRTLLMDRFKLAVHRETQQGQVYKLVLGRGGLKMQDANGGQKNDISWTGPGQITFTENSGLLGLVGVLSGLLGAPVLDETGISGSYSFSLAFTDPRDPRPRRADSPPDLIDAVQDQLGLRLEAAKAPFDVIVIDRIERPSEN